MEIRKETRNLAWRRFCEAQMKYCRRCRTCFASSREMMSPHGMHGRWCQKTYISQKSQLTPSLISHRHNVQSGELSTVVSQSTHIPVCRSTSCCHRHTTPIYYYQHWTLVSSLPFTTRCLISWSATENNVVIPPFSLSSGIQESHFINCVLVKKAIVSRLSILEFHMLEPQALMAPHSCHVMQQVPAVMSETNYIHFRLHFAAEPPVVTLLARSQHIFFT